MCGFGCGVSSGRGGRRGFGRFDRTCICAGMVLTRTRMRLGLWVLLWVLGVFCGRGVGVGMGIGLWVGWVE